MFYKQWRCKDTALRYGCDVFVETGTFRGDTVQAMRPHFQEIHSIEVYPPLYERARSRFVNATNVHIYHGDSASVLRDVLRQVERRALFWLDGHYSGEGTGMGGSECPIEGELAAIGGHFRNDHCILIDDARHFGVDPQYPSTEHVTRLLLTINAGYEIRVENDCIIAIPPAT